MIGIYFWIIDVFRNIWYDDISYLSYSRSFHGNATIIAYIYKTFKLTKSASKFVSKQFYENWRFFRNGRRQFPEPQQPYRRIDTVIGSSHDNLLNEEAKPMEVVGEVVETKTETPMKEDPGFLDSYFGDGAQVEI